MYMGRYLVLIVFVVSPVLMAEHYEPGVDKSLFFLEYLQKENPYRQAVARVKTEGSLPFEEEEFLEKRSALLKQEIEKIVGYHISDEDVPRIAISGSGGGYRAMISLTGFLEGAQLAGVPITYVAGVSGSTWCAMPWVASGTSIVEFKNNLFPTLHYGLLQISQSRDLNDVTLLLLKKWVFGQPITFVDLYGSILSYNLLFDQQRTLLHGTLAARLQDALFPMPIGCALGGDNIKPYYWFEFSPFEVGSTELNSYVPTWAFGREFKRGVSVDYAPEQTLGYFLGTFGSAFAECNFKDIYGILIKQLLEKKQPILSSIINEVIEKYGSEKEVGGAKVHNFMYGMNSSPLAKISELSFVDAGITFDQAAGVGANISLIPLLRKERAVDIIIIVDASATVASAAEFGNAIDYARKLGYSVPEVDYTRARDSVVSVWYPKGDGPIIIYMPNIKNDGYSPDFDPRDIAHEYTTFNFNYTTEQAHKLSGLVSYNVQQAKDTIHTVIQNVVARKISA